jgi:type II secretion system protein J
MSRDLSKQGGLTGMTLIEILVAISVSTIIMGIALSAYLTLSASLRRQADTRLDDALVALDNMRHDLASCSQASFSNTPIFEVRTTGGNDETSPLSALSFCSVSLPPKANDLSRMEVHRIRYTLQPSRDTGGTQTLTRESLTLWGAEALASPVSNAVLKGVSRFEVQVMEGSGWTNQWTSRLNRQVPRATRVRLDWEAARTTETASIVIFIPAGNNLSPQAKSTR